MFIKIFCIFIYDYAFLGFLNNRYKMMINIATNANIIHGIWKYVVDASNVFSSNNVGSIFDLDMS